MAVPLAERLRPQTIQEFIGQRHLLEPGRPIHAMLQAGSVSSLIFWGPPGCGKTTLAHLIAKAISAEFVVMSAITNTVSDIRKTVQAASEKKTLFHNDTVVFIDEIHRFNKGQQDALLPAVEKGQITLIGATTENPGFAINAPLLSRAHVYQLQQLDETDVESILNRALIEYPDHRWEPAAITYISQFANGDARAALNAIELAASTQRHITTKVVEAALQRKSLGYDKQGDNHYDTVSAFIKSMRGNNPDATLHYLARMIQAGEDPMFIARRMIIFASEDIGNAQPTALVLATSTMQAVHMIGMPEAKLILAQTATYLATAKKSIASTEGIAKAIQDLNTMHIDAIPLHLRNPSNKVMKQAGYGKGHVRYPVQKEQSTGVAVEQEYMPKNLIGRRYYDIDANNSSS